MKIKCVFRGLLSVVLAAALFLSAFPQTTRADEISETAVTEETADTLEISEITEPTETEAIEETTQPTEAAEPEPPSAAYQRIRSLDTLTSGQYVLITAYGYAPGVLQGDSITAVQPVADGDTVTDPLGAEWTLTVEGGTVKLTDSSGTAIAPGADGENAVTSGDYGWNVTCGNGLFSFHGTVGGESVTLAESTSTDLSFRACRDSAITASPESYATAFALYRLGDIGTEPETVTVSAVAQAASAQSVFLRGTIVLADGDCCILQDATGGIRLSFANAPSIAPGDVFLVAGTKHADFAVTMYEKTGTAALPAAEVTVDAILADQGAGTLKNTRVVIKNAMLSGGMLTQGEASIPITVPQGVSDGEMAEIYAVILDDGLRVASAEDVIPVSTEETIALYTAAPEDTPPTDTAAVTITPSGGEIKAGTDSIVLQCATEDASIYYATSPDGVTYTDFTPYTGEITPKAGFGTLYIKAYAAKEGFLDSGETLCVFTESAAMDYRLYFGLLHAHSTLSDGNLNITELFANAANAEGMDFFAVTDHSNSFDNDEAGSIGLDGTAVSSSWAAGKAAAAAVTDKDFVGIFGYEMTWQDGKHLGHIGTFNTPGWQSRNQADYANQLTALETYYQTLTTVPGSISQFNHPGTAYGTFENFGHYSAAYDEVIKLLEVGSEKGCTAYQYYTQALDKGWHVAPTNNHFTHAGSWGDGRTVILADTLTEAALYDAMDHYRVYATEDSDLTIYYQLDGHIMGSLLRGSSNPEIRVYLHDPTDAAIGNVEVIVDGGAVAASQTVSEASATVTFTPPGGYSYYYIRVTQPDGDVAVTAPVWVDSTEDMGISSFTAGTELPVQGQEIGLSLKLYNNETVDFTVDSMEFSIDGEMIHAAENPGTVGALDTLLYAFPYVHPGMGVTEIRAAVTGTVCGERRTYAQTLTLRFRAADMVTSILVDGSHGNFGVTALNNLTAVAAETDTSVEVFTGALPDSGNLLIVSAPTVPFEEDFLTAAAEFVKSGGSIIVCGRFDAGDGALHTSAELNRLLAAVGSTLRLCDDTAIDEVNNGGESDALYPTVFNSASSWCEAISDDQFYSHQSGCTVSVGSGTWLVKGLDTTHSADLDNDGRSGSGAVLLACEETAYGGTVFAAGSLFLSDRQMEASRNRWDPVRANEAILDKLLGIQRVQWPMSTIADVRNGGQSEIYRIQGYVTAGTANKYNTFPGTIYLQDDTGGIAVVPFTETGIQVGTPMTVIGYLEIQEGNPVLEIIGYDIPDEDFYRYVPQTVLHKTAMDYAANGGKLMQVEGKVVDVAYTADGKGVSRFTLKDEKGDLATVLIEDYIRSGSSGLNELASEVKKGRTVRAMGILHLDVDGEPVLRARNCEEVVYVPPIPRPNPKTGDNIPAFAGVMVISFTALAALLLVCKKRKI